MSKQNELAQLADAVTVDGSNVGIGTSSPATRLSFGNYIPSNGQTIHTYQDGNTRSGLGIVAGVHRMFTNVGAALSYGHVSTSDGSTYTERMRIDASGAVTMPAQPAFLVRPVGYQTNIPNLTTTTVLFGAEVFDQNSDFSSNTFTAPVTGKYQLNFGLRLEQINSASSYYHIHLRTSNRLYAIIFDPRAFDQNPDYWDAGLGALADMDAGDTAHITVFQAFGSAQMDIQGDSYFSGYLVA